MGGGGREELGTLKGEQVPADGAVDLAWDLRLIVSHLNVAQEAVIAAGPEPRRDKVKRVSEIPWWWGSVCNRVRKGA